jgi:hypothetical protein
MELAPKHSSITAWNTTAAYFALAAAAISCISLAALHVLSAEFAPSWRMVSEYANGEYGWVLTIVFLSWGISSFALIAAIWPIHATNLGKSGLAFLLLGGIGQSMGGLFDINHELHGAAAMIGIPSICIAAVIITMALKRTANITAPPTLVANLPWMSMALMAGAFALLFGALKAAGVDVSGQSPPLQELPSGVSGYVGWANRLIFVTSYLWTILAAMSVIKGRATYS